MNASASVGRSPQAKTPERSGLDDQSLQPREAVGDPMAVPCELFRLIVAKRRGDIFEHAQIVERMDLAGHRAHHGANIGAGTQIARKQRRLGVFLFEILADRNRLDEIEPLIRESGHETLRIDGAVGRRMLLAAAADHVHIGRLRGQALQRERYPDAKGRRRAEVGVKFHGALL